MAITQAATGQPETGPYTGRITSVLGGLDLRTGTYTLALRVKWATAATNNDQTLAGIFVTSNNRGLWLQRISGAAGTAISCYRFNGASTFNTALATGAYGSTTAWVHLGVTYDGTTIRTYVNGVASGTVASASTLLASPSVMDSICIGGPMTGVTADAVLFARALSASEMQQLAKRRMPFMGRGSTDCLGWWPMWDSTSLAAAGTDYSYAGNDCTLQASGANNPAASNTSVPFPVAGARNRIYLPLNTIISIAGAAASSSALAGAAVQAQPVAGTLADSSALSGAVRVHVAAALADSSALTGAAVQAQVLAGALADSSALSGAVRVHVAAALADSSALAGAAVQAQPVAGTLADSSALAGAVRAHVAGAAASSSTLIGTTAALVSGALASSSALSGVFVQTQVVAGAAADSSALSGALTVHLFGNMATGSALAGAAVQAQVLTGALATSSALLLVTGPSGNMVSTSSLSGTAVQSQVLAGALASSSALSGTTAIEVPVSGNLASSSALTGAASQTQPVAGALSDSSILAGGLRTHVAGNLASSSHLAGTATAILAVAGAARSSSALAGVINITAFAAGHLASYSALSGTLVGGQPVIPFVATGWFDSNGITATAEPHSSWQAETTLAIGAHTPWRSETTDGTVTPHTPWSES